jgi:hypothetical protein
MWQLGLLLSLLCVGAAVLRDRCVFGAAAALLVNWIVNTAAVWISGVDFPWGAFLTVDWLTGVFVLVGLPLICGRFTAGPVVIGLSYGLECILHAAFGLSDHGPWPEYRYWWTLYYIAIGQMLFVFGWGLYELGGRYHRARRRVAPDPSGAARGGASPTIAEP